MRGRNRALYPAVAALLIAACAVGREVSTDEADQPAICLTCKGSDGNGGGDGVPATSAWDAVHAANPTWTMDTPRNGAEEFCGGITIFSCTFHLHLPFTSQGQPCMCDCRVDIIVDDVGGDQIVVHCELALPAPGECFGAGMCGSN